MAYLTSGLVGANLTTVTAGTTTDGANALFPLGTRSCGSDGTEWIYVQSGGTIAQYDCILIDEDFQAQAITTTLATAADTSAGDLVGFAQVALADNELGWVALKGANINCKLAINCADHVGLYTTATAGVLDDASAGVRIRGVVSTTTITAATNAEIIASNPVSALVAALAD